MQEPQSVSIQSLCDDIYPLSFLWQTSLSDHLVFPTEPPRHHLRILTAAVQASSAFRAQPLESTKAELNSGFTTY